MGLCRVDVELLLELRLNPAVRVSCEGQWLAAGADRFEQAVRLGGEQDQQGIAARLFKSLEQRVGRANRHAVGFFDQAYFTGRLERFEVEVFLKASDLFDLDRIAFRFEGMQVRVVAVVYLTAGLAVAAAALFVADDGPGKGECHKSFADPVRTREQVGMG